MGSDGCLPGHFDVLQRSLSTTFRGRGKTFYSSSFILCTMCVCVCVPDGFLTFPSISSSHPSLSHSLLYLPQMCFTSETHSTLLFCKFLSFCLPFFSTSRHWKQLFKEKNLFIYFLFFSSGWNPELGT